MAPGGYLLSELKTPYEDVLRTLETPVRDVVVLPKKSGGDVADHLAELLPEATIHVVDRSANPKRLVRALARLPQPQLIVDPYPADSDVEQSPRFLATAGFLERGGAYVAGGGSADTQPVVVRQPFEQRFKIRDADANALLTERFGQRWGRVLHVEPAMSYTSAAVVTIHGTRSMPWNGVGPEPSSHGTIDVPEMYVRQYHGVTCWARQRVALDNYWLPDTFRHPLHRTLSHRALVNSAPRHARLPSTDGMQARRVHEPCFYFDSEYPSHFGHFLSEVLARVWGWRMAQRHEPNLRPLVGLAQGRRDLPGYQRRIYSALGVDMSHVEYVHFEDCLQVDTLYAATPAFAMPQYASPLLSEDWSAAARVFVAPGADTPRRLFVGRRVRGIRSCQNTEEVEAFFTALGFTVVYPEDHDFADQVTMFANADVIAGFVGSGLFNTMFTRDKTVLIISPDTYTATNEYLIAGLTGARLHYFLADAEIKHTAGGWSWKAYQSNFRFDVDKHAEGIRAVIRG